MYKELIKANILRNQYKRILEMKLTAMVQMPTERNFGIYLNFN
jgi:hypothetical protein